MQAGAVNRDLRWETGRCCPFTEALAQPSSSFGPWKVVHCASPASDCAVTRLARLAAGDVPALWLARLEAEVEDDAQEASVQVRSTCCGLGAAGVSITLNGSHVGCLDAEGELRLDATASCAVGIQGIPACLLPGSTNKYLAHFNCSRRMVLDLSCLVWAYWLRLDEDPDSDGMVFVCTNVEQIPDEAMPISGRLSCPGAEEPDIILDGQSVGPLLLRRSRVQAGGCLVAQLMIHVVQAGYEYFPKVPSPLQERHEELGGCELQRLMHSPIALGTLKPKGRQIDHQDTDDHIDYTEQGDHEAVGEREPLSDQSERQQSDSEGSYEDVFESLDDLDED